VATSSKKRVCHFKSDQYDIWKDCSLSNCKCASIDGVGFWMWRTFKMVAMASFHKNAYGSIVKWVRHFRSDQD